MFCFVYIKHMQLTPYGCKCSADKSASRCLLHASLSVQFGSRNTASDTGSALVWNLVRVELVQHAVVARRQEPPRHEDLGKHGQRV